MVVLTKQSQLTKWITRGKDYDFPLTELYFGTIVTHSKRVCQLQQRNVRIMTVARPPNSCKSMFKASETVTVTAQYILPLITLWHIIWNTSLSTLCAWQ